MTTTIWRRADQEAIELALRCTDADAARDAWYEHLDALLTHFMAIAMHCDMDARTGADNRHLIREEAEAGRDKAMLLLMGLDWTRHADAA